MKAGEVRTRPSILRDVVGELERRGAGRPADVGHNREVRLW